DIGPHGVTFMCNLNHRFTHRKKDRSRCLNPLPKPRSRHRVDGAHAAASAIQRNRYRLYVMSIRRGESYTSRAGVPARHSFLSLASKWRAGAPALLVETVARQAGK